MTEHETANPHLAEGTVEWGSPDAVTTVIAVHGRGQGPDFMREQSNRITGGHYRYVAPAAAGRSWYPQPFLAPRSANEPDLTHALDTLEQVIAECRAGGVPAERILLWGFSQGACLVAHLLLTRPPRVGGAAIMTGGWVGAEALDPVGGRPLEGIPVLLRSIEHDPWVPAHRVIETAECLGATGAAVDVAVAPGAEHIITDEAMAAASALLIGLDTGRTPTARQ